MFSNMTLYDLNVSFLFIALINELVSKLHCKSPHMRVYHKEQLPIRYHYADNPRIEPIFVDIDNGWTVVRYY